MPQGDLRAQPVRIDALLPAEVALRAEEIGVQKAQLGWRNTLALGVLGGAFIALGGMFSNTATAGAAGALPFGVVRLLAGVTFCLGLILVVVAGAELFTGNNLIVMAWASRRIKTRQVLRNWGLVYLGNFLGALASAVLIYLSGHWLLGNGAVGQSLLASANAKCNLGFGQAFFLGALCNALVCLAIWLCYSARSNTDKIISILFPISAFVAGGFEHCVANMYHLPAALLLKAGAPQAFWQSIAKTAADYGHLSWANFLLGNLLPVTLGSIVGGALMVGLVYWFIYIRKRPE